ncbi:MAG: ribonuclease [Acidobacteriaceae bacterium]|nr:ribonuclease [Acidobacteriaceae bacterium]
MVQRTLETLEHTLKHRFRDPALLEQALTHSSLAFEKSVQETQEEKPANVRDEKPTLDNEKLEFLGDAVLGLLVAQSLYESFPDLEEGDLTRMRAALVSRRHLANVAELLHLGDHLRLGRGEERNGGRRKAVLLANSFEAVLAALYLDAGIDIARSFVQRTVIEPTAQRLYKGLERGDSMGDHKSALQEMLQAKGAAPPEYEVKAESGPDHRKRFLVEVVIPAAPQLPPVTAQGTGTTKKRAEQEAARVAFQQLQEQTIAPITPTLETSAGRKAPTPLQEQTAAPNPPKSVTA